MWPIESCHSDNHECPARSVTCYKSFQMMRLLPRDAMLARHVLLSCLCPSVHPSVTSRISTKTAKHRNMQQHAQYPRDSCSFLTPKISTKFRWDHPQWGRKIQWGWLKWAISDKYLAIFEEWCKVGT